MWCLLPLLLLSACRAAQTPLLWPSTDDSHGVPSEVSTGAFRGGHLSQWSRLTKETFLSDVRNNDAREWTIVMGNEGGDLDSMVSAIAWAYHLSHLEHPRKAVALLQTEADALDLRPENLLALQYARMASGHKDLLSLDELPIKPDELGHRIKGISIVDHNSPRSFWGTSKILSIIDHHVDRKLALHASPRLIQLSASCSSLVAKLILDHDEQRSKHTNFHGPVPRELVDLLLRTIALDSDGLRRLKKGDQDRESASRLLGRSTWKGMNLKDVMQDLDEEMGKAKKDLAGLSVRDLMRRDWKGDFIPTESTKYPTIALGFASTPVSMNEQITRTPEQTSPEWFAIERAWTAESGNDVSVALNSFRDEEGNKVREIALVVAHGYGKRLEESAADSLFHAIKLAIETAPFLEVNEWVRPDGKPLLPRRAVWSHSNSKAGRKLIRPLVEKAVRQWGKDIVKDHAHEKEL